MKKVLTKYHGELPLNELICIHFPDGIPALEQYTKYTLLPFDDSALFILQSLEEAEIAFLVVDIFKIESTYDYVVPKHAIDKLLLERAEEVLTLGIITPKEPFEKSTVNLYAPIIINQSLHLGKQIFLEQSGYQVKAPLFKRQETVK